MPRRATITVLMAAGVLAASWAPASAADAPATGPLSGGTNAPSVTGGTSYGSSTEEERAREKAEREARERAAREKAAKEKAAREKAAAEREAREKAAAKEKAKRERAARARKLRSTRPAVSAYFPVRGDWTFTGFFGEARTGHKHAGVDIAASEGTPVVAPRSGTITNRGYQAGGAGNYLVMSDGRNDFDYVFMHLRDDSLRVDEGDRVRAGERIADVGNTGSSTGPHLHFEIWDGAWYDGGHAIDPLATLKHWSKR